VGESQRTGGSPDRRVSPRIRDRRGFLGDGLGGVKGSPPGPILSRFLEPVSRSRRNDPLEASFLTSLASLPLEKNEA